jgi:LysM repeat protein
MIKNMLKFLGAFALVSALGFAPISLAQTALAASSTANQAANGTATNDPISYTVQPGDNLFTIAQTYNTTVNAIVALNPQITDPSLIYPGELLQIPVGAVSYPTIPITGYGPSAVISPSSGSQGSDVQVVVTGFPADTPIEIGLHKLGDRLIESTADLTTNASGNASITMQIPKGANANIGLVWLAQVSTTSGESITINSSGFTITAK